MKAKQAIGSWGRLGHERTKDCAGHVELADYP